MTTIEDTSFLNHKSSEEILLHIESHKLLLPEVYLTHAAKVLSQQGQKGYSTTRRLTILEQVVLSALHVNNASLAESSLKEIKALVGKESTRYRKLLAQCLEAQEEYQQALDIYNDLIATNPSNISVLKRIYCIHKAKGDDLLARQTMNEYLERNGADAAAWIVLAKDCMEEGDYKGAAYCYEEAILVSPVDASLHCILGELYTTIATKESLILARKHFCMCLELEGANTNLRAIFGLVSAVENYIQLELSNQGKKKGRNVDEESEEHMDVAKELKKLGVEKLIKAYHGHYYGDLLAKFLSIDAM
jgi:tetratricopeptide (TPR) repeat protein